MDTLFKASNGSTWICYMLFASIIMALIKAKLLILSKVALERVLVRSLTYAFLLSLATLATGGVLAYQDQQEQNAYENHNNEKVKKDLSTSQKDTIQDSQNIMVPKKKITKPSVNHYDLKTEGKQSPIVVTGEGDVNISFGERKRIPQSKH